MAPTVAQVSSIERIRVEKRKYPDRVRGAWEAMVVGDDDFGLWLFAPAGERNRHNLSGVQLLTRGRWWVAWWWDDPKGLWCAADVCTPVFHSEDVWSYDDLEIDVVGNEAGFVGVVDEDEFEDARLSVPYPSDVTDAALAVRDEVVTAMHAHHEPFGQLGWKYLNSSLTRIR